MSRDDDEEELEYRVVQFGSFVELEKEVNRLLRAGWQLQGGVSTTSGFYCQALVRVKG